MISDPFSIGWYLLKVIKPLNICVTRHNHRTSLIKLIDWSKEERRGFFANSFYKRTINIIFIIFFWMRKKLYHEDLTFINKKLTAWECIYNRHKTHESAVDSTITLTITNWNQIIIASCSHMNPSYLKRKLGCKINAQNLYIADLDPFENI